MKREKETTSQTITEDFYNAIDGTSEMIAWISEFIDLEKYQAEVPKRTKKIDIEKIIAGTNTKVFLKI